MMVQGGAGRVLTGTVPPPHSTVEDIWGVNPTPLTLLVVIPLIALTAAFLNSHFQQGPLFGRGTAGARGGTRAGNAKKMPHPGRLNPAEGSFQGPRGQVTD